MKMLASFLLGEAEKTAVGTIQFNLGNQDGDLTPTKCQATNTVVSKARLFPLHTHCQTQSVSRGTVSRSSQSCCCKATEGSLELALAPRTRPQGAPTSLACSSVHCFVFFTCYSSSLCEIKVSTHFLPSACLSSILKDSRQ